MDFNCDAYNVYPQCEAISLIGQLFELLGEGEGSVDSNGFCCVYR